MLAPPTESGGRNVYGRKTSRHRGGGPTRQYRIVDFTRTKDGVTAKVAAIEYDPNRTCRIALLHYADGEKAYILAPKGLNVGDHVSNGAGSDIKPGNALPLRYIPVGTTVHHVELPPRFVDLRHSRLHLFRHGNVGAHGHRLAALRPDAVDRLGQVIHRAAQRGNPGPGLRQPNGRRLADARPRPRYQRNFVV